MARHEQRADGGAGEHRVNDHGDGRREDRADGGTGRRDGAGEAVIVALFAHGVDLKLAETGGIGDGGAGHAGENERGEDVDMRQTAAEAADETHAGAENVLGDLTGVHYVRGKDKQWYRDDGAVGKYRFDGLLRHKMQAAARAR